MPAAAHAGKVIARADATGYATVVREGARVPEGAEAPFRALVVDFGGVLTTPMQDAMAAFAEEAGIDLQDLVRAALGAYSGGQDPLVEDFETGKIAEEEFAVEFAQRLGRISGRPIPAEGIVRRIFRIKLEDDMIGAVAAVRRAGLKTGLLSNSWGMSNYPMERFVTMFDTVVISGEVGLRKPDPEIFRLTAQRLDVPLGACVMVDDHPGHLKAALEEGMTTILHRSPAETIAELESLLRLSL